MDIEPITIAYIAGVIDSDGYISITRSCRNGRLYHGPIVGIAGTRRQPHDLAASIWGGSVYTYKPKNPRYRSQFQWVRTGRSSVPVIEAVRPYLLVKRDQADLALELAEDLDEQRSNDDPWPWAPADFDPIPRRELWRAEMVEILNQDRHSARLPIE